MGLHVGYSYIAYKKYDYTVKRSLLDEHCCSVKGRSHDPILRIRFVVPKIGSRGSDGPISRFRFCGENVGRSFVVCLQDPIFRTYKESSIWRQDDHAKFVGAFHLSRRMSDENRACSISIRSFKITDPCVGRSFSMCSHDPIFGINKSRILKNGSCERALNMDSKWYAGRKNDKKRKHKFPQCWIRTHDIGGVSHVSAGT